MEGFLDFYFLFLEEVASVVSGSYYVDLGGSNSHLEKGVAPLLHGFNL